MASKPLLLSIAPSIRNVPFLTTDALDLAVGLNSGNLAFVHAVDRQLGGPLRRFERNAPTNAINSAPESVAVLPSANHLGVHQDLGGEARHFAAIEKPIVSIGLGAQSGSSMEDIPELPQGSVAWLKTLADHAPTSAPNISVRGEFTMRVLEKYGVSDRAVVLGCPSLFLNSDPGLGKVIAENLERPIVRVAVAAGHYRWTHLRNIERSMAKIVEDTFGAYILQSPREMLAAYRRDWSTLPSDVEDALRSFISGDRSVDVRSWYQRYSRMFFDVPSWMEYLRSFDFVVGARIHGVMLALQAGVPGLCIAHDSRTVELCETMSIPYVEARAVSNGFNLEDLQRLARFDADAFDSRRMELSVQYAQFLKANDIRASELLRV